MSADCEANYVRLCRLLPGVVALAQSAREHADPAQLPELRSELVRALQVDLSAGEPAELTLELSEQCRYTTTLNVTVRVRGLERHAWLRSGKNAQEGVHMSVRLYHDVRLAEVIAFSGARSALASYSYPNEVMFQPDEKAQQNRFLAEWLSHALNHGLASHSESHNAAAFYAQPSCEVAK